MRRYSADYELEKVVEVDIRGLRLEGNLVTPASARGIVAFAHGSGSSRHSSRNRFVASELNRAGLATLLFDLLTPEEEEVDLRTHHLRFNIPLLAQRVVGAVDWIRRESDLMDLNVGLFGASTGAAAALMAAADRPGDVGAVVSRGGRPDLAGDALPLAQAPTLLIVGGDDVMVIDLNREAYDRMTVAERRMTIVPGAGHLFEEAGKLDEVARLATEWFAEHLQEQ